MTSGINIYGPADDVTMSIGIDDIVCFLAASAVYLVALLVYNVYKPNKKKQ